MTATNHILSGAIIGAFLPLPVAIPLAFVSHFILDAIPHYGLDDIGRRQVRMFKIIVYSDTVLSLALVIALVLMQQWSLLLCGFLAFSPDLPWIFHYFEQGRKMERLKSTNRINDWHQNRLQRERPEGIFIELVFAAAMLPIFIVQLLKV